jgi:hypothetical protein
LALAGAMLACTLSVIGEGETSHPRRAGVDPEGKNKINRRTLDRIDYFRADVFDSKPGAMEAVKRLQAVIFFKPVKPDAAGVITFDDKAVAQLARLKAAIAPGTSILIGVGSLTPLVDNPTALAATIARFEELRSSHGFTGIDLDWEDMPENKVPVEKYAAVVFAIAAPWRANGLVVSTSHGQGPQYRRYAAAVKNIVNYVNLQFYYSKNNAMPLPDFRKSLDAYVALGLKPSQIRVGLPSYGMVEVVATQTREKWRTWAALVGAGVDVKQTSQWTDPKNGETYYFSGLDLLGAKIDHVRAAGFAGIFTWELSFDVPYTNALSINRFIDDRTLATPE